MISPVDSLMNMEYALYGGMSGYNTNCPSYTNGYKAANLNSYMSPYMMGYNPVFQKGYGANTDIFTTSQTPSASQTSQTSFGASQDDLDVLGKYYIKGLNPSESFASAAIGGAAFGLVNNPRLVAHPWNSFTSTKAVEKMFSGIKDASSNLGKMWADKKGGYEILSEAYSRMHKLEALNKSKIGLFRKSIKGVEGSDGKLIYDTLKKQMTDALASGDKKLIAEATEAIKRQTNAFTGHIPRFMRWAHIDKPFAYLRKKFINPSHYQDLAKVAGENVARAGEKTTFAQFMKHSCGIGNGILFAGLEFVMDFMSGKIQRAFSKDSETGWKQICQTAIKGVGSAVGWAVGEGIGAWAGAKAGAALGTAISPGVGTAIGAVAGLIGGSIGCWLTGKLTHKIIGTEAGDQVEVDEMKKTAQGQVQLLQLTAQQAQNDKKIDPKVLQAIQNVANVYA